MEDQAVPPLLPRLGGEQQIEQWMTIFYEQIATHSLLAPLFTRDLADSRERQVAFMIEFFGGEPRYTEKYGKAFLRFKHRHVTIGVPERDAWMQLILATLSESIQDADLIAEVEAKLAPMATAMINHDEAKKDAYFFR